MPRIRRRRIRRFRRRRSYVVKRESTKIPLSIKRFVKECHGNDRESYMKDKSIEQQKTQFLLKQGWKVLEPEFNLLYFAELGLEAVIKETGFFISEFTNRVKDNWFNLFGEDVKEVRDTYLSSICPNASVPNTPSNCPMISSQWPLEFNDCASQNAFAELTYRTIVRIVGDVLPNPNFIYQETRDKVFVYPDVQSFSFSDVEIIGTTTVVWDNAYLTIEPSSVWTSTGTINALEWRLYSKDLRTLSSEALKKVGLEINPNTYQLGVIDPEFRLKTFPAYIREYSDKLIKNMFEDGGFPQRYNILVEGPYGYGKTCWSHAFATEILSSMGYIIIVVDYSSIEELVLPSYLDKVCIIINDADNLCIDREVSNRGETEQMLAWLDGARTNFIKPFYLNRRSSTITILTANTIERWDKAALRQGRIHAHYMFDQVKLSDKQL
jgi:hypothetical protein